MTSAEAALNVKRRARSLGFDGVGITHLDPVPHRDALERWLANGMAGTMTYMHRQAENRKAPERILAGATRVVVLTKSYYAPDPPRPPGSGRVAKYARGADYHSALRDPLEQLAAYVIEIGGDKTIARTFVDAGPVPERELAQRAGLGWIGKNTMLLNPERGSYFFLASVLTNLDLEVDAPFPTEHCGTCTRCLDACPTDAFPEPYVLDATRCISYLTIEHRGAIPQALGDRFGDWVFGCDVCQDVCPWNLKFAAADADTALPSDGRLAFLDVEELRVIGEADFEDRLAWTALERTGASGLRRNAEIVVRNEGRRAPSGFRDPSGDR